MNRCQYTKCDRVVRDPNKYGLCHVHIDMADFFLWFSDTLQRAERAGGRGASVRASGLVVPPAPRRRNPLTPRRSCHSLPSLATIVSLALGAVGR